MRMSLDCLLFAGANLDEIFTFFFTEFWNLWIKIMVEVASFVSNIFCLIQILKKVGKETGKQ